MWPRTRLRVFSPAAAVQILVALLQAGEGALLADVLLHQQILGFAALLQGGEDFLPGQVALAHRRHDGLPALDGHVL